MMKWNFFFWLSSLAWTLAAAQPIISIPFIGHNDLINHTVITLSDDRVLEHPDISQILVHLHDCEAYFENCPHTDNITSLATKVTNEYLSLLLPERALQLLDDITYFLHDREELLRSKLKTLELAIHLAVGRNDKASVICIGI